MRTADQVRWDFVQEWLRKAESDTAALRICEDIPYRSVSGNPLVNRYK